MSNPQSAVYFLGLFVFFSSHLSQFLCFLKLDFTITDFGYAGDGRCRPLSHRHHPLLAARGAAAPNARCSHHRIFHSNLYKPWIKNPNETRELTALQALDLFVGIVLLAVGIAARSRSVICAAAADISGCFVVCSGRDRAAGSFVPRAPCMVEALDSRGPASSGGRLPPPVVSVVPCHDLGNRNVARAEQTLHLRAHVRETGAELRPTYARSPARESVHGALPLAAVGVAKYPRRQAAGQGRVVTLRVGCTAWGVSERLCFASPVSLASVICVAQHAHGFPPVPAVPDDAAIASGGARDVAKAAELVAVAGLPGCDSRNYLYLTTDLYMSTKVIWSSAARLMGVSASILQSG